VTCKGSHLDVDMAFIVNLGILGGVGYVAYQQWDRPWDRRTVSAVSIGLLGLFTGEG
jgi:hypothetical protein